MKGIVGVIAQEGSRHTQFWADLNELHAPDGVETRIEWTGTIGQARSEIVRQFLETDAQWLVMLDDDHAIHPDFLRAWLYRHDRKLNAPLPHPIVASLYLQRGLPFAPALYGPPDSSLPGRMTFEHLTLDQFPTSGIAPVYAAGASGMFVRRDVYEALRAPWYELGQSDNIGEDFWFCHKAQLAGIPVVVDLDARLGHFVTCAVWPEVHEGQWMTSIRRGSLGVLVDAARPADDAVMLADAALIGRQ